MVAFTKTVVLHTTDGLEYKICNDMLHWQLPSEESLKVAFTKTAVSPIFFSLLTARDFHMASSKM